MKGNEDSLRDLWDNIKHTNIQYINNNIVRVPEAEERKKGPEKILQEIVAEKFPDLGKEKVTQVQKAQSPIQD